MWARAVTDPEGQHEAQTTGRICSALTSSSTFPGSGWAEPNTAADLPLDRLVPGAHHAPQFPSGSLRSLCLAFSGLWNQTISQSRQRALRGPHLSLSVPGFRKPFIRKEFGVGLKGNSLDSSKICVWSFLPWSACTGDEIQPALQIRVYIGWCLARLFCRPRGPSCHRLHCMQHH